MRDILSTPAKAPSCSQSGDRISDQNGRSPVGLWAHERWQWLWGKIYWSISCAKPTYISVFCFSMLSSVLSLIYLKFHYRLGDKSDPILVSEIFYKLNWSLTIQVQNWIKHNFYGFSGKSKSDINLLPQDCCNYGSHKGSQADWKTGRINGTQWSHSQKNLLPHKSKASVEASKILRNMMRNKESSPAKESENSSLCSRESTVDERKQPHARKDYCGPPRCQETARRFHWRFREKSNYFRHCSEKDGIRSAAVWHVTRKCIWPSKEGAMPESNSQASASRSPPELSESLQNDCTFQWTDVF